MELLQEIVRRLVARDARRSEADVQSDVKLFLTTAALNLREENLEIRLESPVGRVRRIDVEIGATVIEVKKDLRIGNVRTDAIEQLAGYVRERQTEFACRYVGVLTDGAEWSCHHLVGGKLSEVSQMTLDGDRNDHDKLASWLEGVLATTRDVQPTPEIIARQLGSGSSAHQLDRATLKALFENHRNVPEVKTKRLLWSKLLATALGTQFQDSDDLFIEHTLLVNSAEIIAHAVLGFDVQHLAPRAIVAGDQFDDAQVYGVIEKDFFDWACDVSGGDAFIRSLARRLSRFRWSDVDHDVLKVLYESVITPDTRKKLGEYYTPDWLAHQIVEKAVPNPLEQRVLDPACGSGTFLFHAIRRYLDAAKAKKWRQKETLDKLTLHVIGMDLHPVAVTLARVTYLLAIGRDRLASETRGSIRIPVFLGDSIQWRKQEKDLFNGGELRIAADDKRETVPQEFRFPLDLLDDPQNFDSLVSELAQLSAKRTSKAVPNISRVLDRHTIRKEHHQLLTNTFKLMCHLHDEGRNHVWGYYIRNLARPEWLTQPQNRIDTLVGNPPWLAFRHMPADMQQAFQKMSLARGLWHGAKVATHQDLSALFAARAIELYLEDGGTFGFVMPSAVIDAERQHYRGFRTGNLSHNGHSSHVAFGQPWDLKRLRPHFFPISASVIFGSKQNTPVAMPPGESWTGRLEKPHGTWKDVEHSISRSVATTTATTNSEPSPYADRFRQGATIVPRVLFMVERRKAGPLGHAQGKAAVRSLRSANEKPPWKNLEDREGVVESIFVRPVYTGESVLPYRIRPPAYAVIPRDKQGLMDGASERLDQYPELAKWWRAAETTWKEHRSSPRLSLVEQLNFRGKLEAQFRIPPLRVLYGRSGMHLAAAYTDDARAVIDNSLYWAAAANVDEALYLCAIMNAAVTTRLVRPLMSYGKDERDIHKSIWRLPIPYFETDDVDHVRLVECAKILESEITQADIPDELHFAAARRRLREVIEASPSGREIEVIVGKMLGA